MLQFICESNDRYSQAELAQMAVEGGCRWIQLRFAPDAAPEYIREVTGEVIPLCKEASVFLTIEDMPDAVKEYAVHGIYLSRGGMAKAVECREALGPEAVVGVELATLTDIDAAEKSDIDYVTLPRSMSLEKCTELIQACRASGVKIPIVAIDRATLANLAEIMAAGFNGVAVGNAISSAQDPEKRTEEFLDALS